MRIGIELLTAMLLVAGCDEGQVHPTPAPRTPAVVIAIDAGPAAKPKLLGAVPASLGPAFEGVALGQTIDQHAAEQFLKQREIPATPFVRDGHLVSLRLRLERTSVEWPNPRDADSPSWFDATTRQHASETITEQGSYLQFDLEVPIERWMNMTEDSIVRFDLVTKSLDDARTGPRGYSSSVDGHSSETWTDSALAGSSTATEVSVQETQSFRNVRRTGDGWEIEEIPGAKTHGLYITLDAPPAIRDAISRRLTELFGVSAHDRNTDAETWKRSKIRLTHTSIAPELEHIELSWER